MSWADWLAERARDQVRQALSADIDATRLADVQAELRPRFEATAGVRLSTTDLVVRAATLVALEHPALIAGPHAPIGPGIDVGLVVVAPDGRPAVMTIEEAHARPLVQLAGEREDARSRQTTPDGAGAALLVSNLGPYGVDHFVPGAAPSTAPVLGVGRIRGAVDGRLAMWVSLSVDARFVSMVTAAGALERLRALLERPSLLIA